MDDIIIKYLQGEAGETEKKQLLDWLNASEENKKQFAGMREAWLAAGDILPSGGLYAQKAHDMFMRQVAAHENKKRNHSRSFRFARMAAAGVLLLLLLGGSYFAGMKRNPDELYAKEIVMNHFRMGKDSKDSIVLPDGTTVWLHAGSELFFPDTFSGKQRKVTLRGEGYFEVSPDKDKPFIVEAGGMEVKVLGTSFDIQNYAGRKTAEVTLLTGEVEVFLPVLERTVALKPDQKIVWNTYTEEYTLENVDARKYISWINDRLSFNKEKLSDALFHLERWYNIDIFCDDKVNMEELLTFTVRREEKEEIFKLLGMISSVQYRIEGNKVYVTPGKAK